MVQQTKDLITALRLPEPDEPASRPGNALVEYASSEDSGTPAPSVDNVKVGELAETLKRLVKIFDTILWEEFVPEHQSLPCITGPSPRRGPSVDVTRRQRTAASSQQNSDPRASCNLACDFCGADIFQSFFECTLCKEPAAVEPRSSLGDGLLVCSGCYIEGRTCMCGDMVPAQCRPLEVLVDDRNLAAKALSEAHDDFKVGVLDMQAEWKKRSKWVLLGHFWICYKSHQPALQGR